MPRSIQTAVVAAAAQQARTDLVRMLSAEGIALLAMEADAHSAIRALGFYRPDLFIADMELPVMNGGALLMRICSRFELPVRPAAMLLRYPEFPVADEAALLESGVALVEKPVNASAFRAALHGLRCAPIRFSGTETRRADMLLDALGVPEHRGKSCLRAAILLCAADERNRFDLGGRLYPQIGEICALDAGQAERAMRHAIDLAWKSDKFENQYRIFADTVDAGRGQPTCGEMISRLADILRSEG